MNTGLYYIPRAIKAVLLNADIIFQAVMNYIHLLLLSLLLPSLGTSFHDQDEEEGGLTVGAPFAQDEATAPFVQDEATAPFVQDEAASPFVEDEATSPLKINELNEHVASGKFLDAYTGEGIQFQTKSDKSIKIATTSGRVILNVGSIFYTEGSNGKMYNSLVEMGGKSFLRQSDEEEEEEGDYYLSSSQAEKIKSALSSNDEVMNQEAVQTVLQGVDKTDVDYHREAMAESITDLLDDNHYPVINRAVHYMGEKMHLTGRDYPSLLPLYLMAMKLEEISDNVDEEWWWSKPKKKYPKNLNCLKTCKPCKKYKCLGLCGKGCDCWKWACGDCCYHYACWNHDLDCLNCGQYSYKCLAGALTVPFTCDSNKKPKLRKKC